MQQVDVCIVIYHHQRACRLVQCDVAYALIAEDSRLVIRLHVLVARGVGVQSTVAQYIHLSAHYHALRRLVVGWVQAPSPNGTLRVGQQCHQP